ncbi:hypothetical protein A2412_03865 [Candidatus Peribacteria bacterium RIFOXYC1_FULL_58_8]|nr:MAG: hypothetical protein A2412_03865 [Candidatus Peribacteria bacterium RIFOXYC1_FULL_58_8]
MGPSDDEDEGSSDEDDDSYSHWLHKPGGMVFSGVPQAESGMSSHIAGESSQHATILLVTQGFGVHEVSPTNASATIALHCRCRSDVNNVHSSLGLPTARPPQHTPESAGVLSALEFCAVQRACGHVWPAWNTPRPQVFGVSLASQYPLG